MTILDDIKGGLIVSCQALPDEPLHSSFIMSRMAIAAIQGGAIGIRANSVADIQAIKAVCSQPVIGIIKQEYADSAVFITATLKEVEALSHTGCEIIALDATCRPRPGGITLPQLVKEIRHRYPQLLLMAGCSTVEEALAADHLGFDLIGTTLVGYTAESAHCALHENDFALLKTIISAVKAPVIAEGNINTPDIARRAYELGAHAVVVGSMITRPQLITQKFVASLQKANLYEHQGY